MLDALSVFGTGLAATSESALILTMMVLMLLAGVCAVIFHFIKLPPIIGYLLAGILIINVFNMKDNPSFSQDAVIIFKNLGLVMLMFGIGTELSIDKIRKTGKFAVIVAVIQLPLMVLSGYVFGILLFGLNAVGAITLGAVISGSSTAVVAAVLSTQKRISKENAETLILVTVVEDIGQVIILSMVTPLFIGGNMGATDMIALIIKIVLFMAIAIFIGIKFVPRFLNWIGEKTSGEILLIFSIGLCFAMAWLSTFIGMSMAIGAFLMGMIVSQCKFSHQLQIKTEPMKQLFMAVFFISIGMEVTFSGFVSSLPMAIGIFLVFMISKFVTVFLGYFVGGKNFELSFVSSVSLMAMGEFAFIISSEAYSKGAVDNGFYSAVIGAALMSMVALPIISKKMYTVVDKVHASDGKLKTLGLRAYSVRDDIKQKVDSSPSMGAIISKSLKKTYVCFLLIIVIEIVFSALAPQLNSFFTSLVGEFITVDNLERYVHIGIMLLNFFLLVIPTYSIVSSVKFISKILKEDVKPDATEEEKKIHNIYKTVIDFSTIAIVFVIDFLLMAVVPGPFGDKSSLITIPIAIGIFILATVLSILAKKREKMRENL